MTGVGVIFLMVAVASVYCQDGYYGFGGLDLERSKHHVQEYIDYRAEPKYHFKYEVHDPKHHDIKSHHEERNGKETKGRYELVQPDGRKRIVEYIAGKHGAEYNVKYA